MQVTGTIGRWILERFGVYNLFSGITTNQAEGFNTMLKQYQHWVEAPVDAIVLGCTTYMYFTIMKYNRV